MEFNRKGLISDQGEKKAAFFVLQKAYKENAGKPLFEAAMIEFCVLGLVIAVLVGAIFFLRRSSQGPEEAEGHEAEAHAG
jgi:hypothetical protein